MFNTTYNKNENGTNKKFIIDFYKNANGRAPALEFLKTLDKKVLAKINRTFDLLEFYGSELREPHSKPLDDGIFEMRIQISSTHIRILYFFYNGGVIILTNGFVKKTNKTPKKELTLAKKYRDDYVRRYKKDE